MSVCMCVCIYIYIYIYMCVCVYIYIYIYILRERVMVDFGESDNLIKISGQADKSNTTGLVIIFCSLFK